jgi:teichuronic acid biosynthesis glycosyltransferase TuaG
MRQDAPCSASVSVIVPAFNASATIRRALVSVASQTMPPYEVIVVDDGSRDGTALEARHCAEFMNAIKLRVIEQPNLGAGAARNRGLTEANGQYVAFLDADDEWLPEKLERSVRYLREDGTLKLVAHNGWIISGTQSYDLDIARRFRAARSDLMHGLYRRGFISTSSVVARRDAVTAAGGFDEELRTGQDFDLWLKLLCEPSAAFQVFDDKLTRYHVSPNGITANTRRRLNDTLKIALRHAPSLRRYSGRFALSLWFRILALHAEACRAFIRAGDWVSVAITLAQLPIRLVSYTVRVLTT